MSTSKELKSFVDRIERLEIERGETKEDIKEVYSEARSMGFDIKVLRKLIRLRKIAEGARKDEEELLELYKSSLGME